MNFWESLESGYYDKTILYNSGKLSSIRSKFHTSIYKNIATSITNEKFVLDYACGSGTFLGNFHKKGVGYDISKKQIEYAKIKYNYSSLTFTDSLEDVKKKKFYDLITLLGLIEFLDKNEFKELLKSLFDLVEDGRKIIITTPNKTVLFNFLETIFKKLKIVNYDSVNLSNYDSIKLADLLDEFGYEKYKISKFISIFSLFKITKLFLKIPIIKNSGYLMLKIEITK